MDLGNTYRNGKQIGDIDTDIPVFKYSYLDFMTEKEIDDLPLNEQKRASININIYIYIYIVPAKSYDFEQMEPINLSIEDIQKIHKREKGKNKQNK